MKAYLVIGLSITDIDGFTQYVRNIPELIEKHSGRYLVQGVEPVVVQGDSTPPRVVVLEFPSKRHAEDFLTERESTDLHEIWHRTTESSILLVEGCT